MIGIATAFIDSRKEEEREKKGFSFFSISIVSQCIAMSVTPPPHPMRNCSIFWYEYRRPHK